MTKKKVSLEEAIFPRHSQIFKYTEFDAIRQRFLLSHQNRIVFRKEQIQSKLFFSFEDREKILVNMARLNFYSGYNQIRMTLLYIN